MKTSSSDMRKKLKSSRAVVEFVNSSSKADKRKASFLKIKENSNGILKDRTKGKKKKLSADIPNVDVPKTSKSSSKMMKFKKKSKSSVDVGIHIDEMETSRRYVDKRKLKGKFKCVDDDDFELSSDYGKRRKLPKMDNSRRLVYGSSPLLKRWEYLVHPTRRFGCRMAYYTDLSAMKTIDTVLTRSQLEKFKATRFGQFMNLSSIHQQPKLLHGLLLREVLNDENASVLWINVNGHRLRFGLDEFALVTGLKCSGGTAKSTYVTSDISLISQYFPEKGSITPPRVSVRFNMGNFANDDDAVKMAILFLLSNFFFGFNATRNVPLYVLAVIDCGDYDRYSFGRDIYEYTIESMKGLLSRKSPDEAGLCRYNLYGFYMALQYWFYEVCGLCKDLCAHRVVGDNIPRMLNWRCGDFPKTNELDNRLWNMKSGEMQIKNIYPTEEERRVLDLDGFFAYPEGKELDFDDDNAVVEADFTSFAADGEASTMPTSVVVDILNKLYARQENFERRIDVKLNLLMASVENLVSIDVARSDMRDAYRAPVVDYHGDHEFDGDVLNEKRGADEDGYDSNDDDDGEDTDFNIGRKNDNKNDDFDGGEDGGKWDDGLDDGVGGRLDGDDALDGGGNVSGAADKVDKGVIDEIVEDVDVIQDAAVSTDGGNVSGAAEVDVTDKVDQVVIDKTAVSSDVRCFLENFKDEQCDEVDELVASANAKKLLSDSQQHLDFVFDENIHLPSKRAMRPTFQLLSPIKNEFSNGTSSPKKHFLSRQYVLDENIGKTPIFEELNEFKLWLADGFKGKCYEKEKATLKPSFVYGDVYTVSQKIWFRSLANIGVPLSSSHLDIIFYYLRKKGKYSRTVSVSFTTTDSVFENYLRMLHARFMASGKNYALLMDRYEICAQFMLGFKMRCSRPWSEVDHVLMPIHIETLSHWVLARLTFADRKIYVYDSMSENGDKHRRAVLADVAPFAELIPFLLPHIDFYHVKKGINFRAGAYAGVELLSPFSLEFVPNLPQQSSSDCGLFVMAFAEYFIYSKPLSGRRFDVEDHRARLCLCLYKYGRKKQAENLDSDPEDEPKLELDDSDRK